MKGIHILLIVLFGFLLLPSTTFACGNSCGTNTEKHFSKIESASKSKKADCCDSNNNSKSKKRDGCSGKCGQSKCGCTITSNCFAAVIDLNFKNPNFDFSTQKSKFSNTESFISSGFYSLWLIPKIS